jgi:cell division transport system permease protein
MRQLRILRQVAVETVIGIKRSGWSNWLVISILAIALTIFGGVLQLTVAMKDVVASWGSQLEISAYLKDGIDPAGVARTISQIPEVQVVEIVPKDVAWSQMQSSFKVAAISNPLPNTLHVRLSTIEAVEQTAQRLKTLDSVEHIRYPLKVARNINRFRQFLEIAGAVVTLALTAATLTVIGNTVHLVIQAKQREIEILSLMGVSPWYIKGPMILQGATYGCAAALLAAGFLLALHIYVDPYLHEQLISFLPILPTNSQNSITPTFFVILVLGMAVGAGGGAWTSGKYIKI